MVYYIVYRDITGKQVKRTVGSVKKAAERELAEALRKVERGEYQAAKAVTFNEFALLWLKEKERSTAKATHKFYKNHVERHLIPFFGTAKLRHINPDFVSEYIDGKEGISARTTGYHLTTLRMIFKEAAKRGHIHTNPAVYVSKPRAEYKEMRILLPFEVEAFLQKVNTYYYPLFLTGLMTGMRQGELFALTWDDVNIERKFIHVRKSCSLGEIKEPKSKSSIRVIDVSDGLAEALQYWKLVCPDSKTGLVFPNSRGNVLNHANILSRVFYPALSEAKIARVRFHDLRHTHAAYLIAQGEHIEYIKRRMGHSSVRVTLDLYGHLMPDVGNLAAAKLEEDIFKKMLPPRYQDFFFDKEKKHD